MGAVGALEVFTATLERIVREDGQQPRAIAERVREPLARLITSEGWLTVDSAAGTEVRAHLVAKALDDAWSVVCVVFPAGATTPVHGHGLWGLVAVYDGVEEETVYRRLDDGSIAGRARLERVAVQRNTAGTISLLIPPDQEIHSIRNPGKAPSLSIHVYGGDLTKAPRQRFDVDSGTVVDHRAVYA